MAPAPVHLHPTTCDGRQATAVPQSRLTGQPDPGQKTTPTKPGELFCHLVSGFRGTEGTNLLLVTHANPLKADLGVAGQHILRGAEVKLVCQGVAASLLRPTCKTTD